MAIMRRLQTNHRLISNSILWPRQLKAGLRRATDGPVPVGVRGAPDPLLIGPVSARRRLWGDRLSWLPHRDLGPPC